jgi:hypothetical protein
MSTDHPSDFAAQLELAWAAGFFDGEGSTYLGTVSHRKDWNRLTLGVSQVELVPLERFRAAVGLGRITCSGFPAKAVLKLLWLHLTDVKRAQAQRAMDAEINSGKPTARGRTHCPQGHEYAVHAYVRSDGYRRCRICDRVRQRGTMRRYRARLKARKES